MRILLAWSLLGWAAAAFAADCTPLFYKAEPRDSDWFYAAGKGPDASAAREDALRRLAVKATGTQAAAGDGTLAGWEQDDHGQCDGFSYALIRIDQERLRRNLAALKKPAPPPAAPPAAPVVTNNIDNHVDNITVTAPEHHYALVTIFLAFLLACLTFAYRPRSFVTFFSKPPGAGTAPTPAVVTGRWLTSRFKPVAKLPQSVAVDEVARLGLPKYFYVHKGSGTCHPIPGSADLLIAGIKEQLRAYVVGGWKMTVEDDAVFSIFVKENIVMGHAFFLYGSETPGSTDCEVLYVIASPIEDSTIAMQEEALHTALPWSVQLAAGKMGAQNSAGA